MKNERNGWPRGCGTPSSGGSTCVRGAKGFLRTVLLPVLAMRRVRNAESAAASAASAAEADVGQLRARVAGGRARRSCLFTPAGAGEPLRIA